MDETYCKFVEMNYETMKESFRKYRPDKFSPDIFHDTLISCEKRISENPDTSDSEKMNYVFISYRNNLLREKNYARNRFRDNDIDSDGIDRIKCYFDNYVFVGLFSDIEEKFGESLCELFYRWIIDGDTVAILEIESGVKSLYYKFGKIKKYIEKTYGE